MHPCCLLSSSAKAESLSISFPDVTECLGRDGHTVTAQRRLVDTLEQNTVVKGTSHKVRQIEMPILN